MPESSPSDLSQIGGSLHKVWRYLDLPKLVWLLENKKLYLSRLDFLRDSHEGSITRMSMEARAQFFKEHNIPAEIDAAQVNRHLRGCAYVNCWHMNNNESEAMWRLYSPGEQGLAIQTTYDRLIDAIAQDDSIYLGCVSYLDYDHEQFPATTNLFYPIMHKRIAFEHEREVRLVKILSEFLTKPRRIGPPGVTLDLSLEVFIEGIYINPYAETWYAEVVRSVVRKYSAGLSSRIQWSRMKANPLY